MGRGIRKQGAASIFAGGFFRFAVYACVVCAVIYVGKSAYDFGYAIFDQIPVDDEDHGEDVTVVIKDGASVYQIGKILKSKGLIKDSLGEFLWKRTKRSPMILPIIMEA